MKKIIASLLLIGSMAHAADKETDTSPPTTPSVSLQPSSAASAAEATTASIEPTGWKRLLEGKLKSGTFEIQRNLTELSKKTNVWIHYLATSIIPYHGTPIDLSTRKSIQVYIDDLFDREMRRQSKKDFSQANESLKTQGYPAYGTYINQMLEAVSASTEASDSFEKNRKLALAYCEKKMKFCISVLDTFQDFIATKRINAAKIQTIEGAIPYHTAHKDVLTGSESRTYLNQLSSDAINRAVDNIVRGIDKKRNDSLSQVETEIVTALQGKYLKWSLRAHWLSAE